MATPDDLRAALRAREDAAILRICAEAKQAGLGSISATTVATGRKALNIAQKIQAADSIATSAKEMRALRLDSGVNQAVEADINRFSVYCSNAIMSWLELGWTMQAEGQAEILAAEGGPRATVKLTAEDRYNLSLFNIMGSTPTDIVAWSVATLRHDVSSALGLCLITTAGDAIVGQLGVVQAQCGSRLEQQARQTFLAGCGAAREDMMRALAGSDQLGQSRTCANCNSPLSDHHEHCHDCGEVLGHRLIIADVPYAGGTSHDGQVVYIDRRIPHFITIAGQEVDVWEAIGVHELFEDPLLAAGMPYPDAHKRAEAHEEAFILMKYGIDAETYRKALQPFIDQALAMATDKALIPADLEVMPYTQSDEFWRIIGAAGDYRNAA